jgi:cell fate regulator YaaT (PSP1 superfamily)
MHRIVCVQFREGGPVSHFRCDNLSPDVGNSVVVETDLGVVLGKVVSRIIEVLHTCKELKRLKGIVRVASEEDIVQDQRNRDNELGAYELCKQRIIARNLPMNLIRVESLLDGSKLIFYYTAGQRIDFRELVKDLVRRFHTRIEMKQIGVRNKAKMVGGLGVCGRELCCAGFLKDFEPISIKMAKEQNLALNPTKISGSCGRLMCCLTFEYENYLSSKNTKSKA